MIGWMWENWWVLAAVVAVGVAYAVGGWRLALGVATLGAGVLLYRQGQKDAERSHAERADRIEQERNDAYRDIDNRGTSGNDARDRLHKGDY